MKDEILISILVPVYNQEKYIAKCLNSLIDQTFVFKYQILILDDGSTDNTPKILKRYSRFGSFIKVFHKENEKSWKSKFSHLERSICVGSARTAPNGRRT